MNNKVRQMVYAALLTAIAIIIPIAFPFLRVIIGPFSATLGSHIPMFIAMLISPMVAVIVGVGSTIGFLLSGLAMPIVARASMHIIVGMIGAFVVKKTKSYVKASVITAPIHAIAEALIVIPFVGFDLYQFAVVIFIGTILHHTVDSILSYVVVKSVAGARRKDIYDVFGEITA